MFSFRLLCPCDRDLGILQGQSRRGVAGLVSVGALVLLPSSGPPQVFGRSSSSLSLSLFLGAVVVAVVGRWI